MNKLMDRAQQALEAARNGGVDDCLVSVELVHTRSLSVMADEWQSLTSGNALKTRITVHHEQHRATAAATGPVDVDELVQQALESARANPPDEYLAMADPDPCTPLEGEFDPRLTQLDAEAFPEMLQDSLVELEHPLVVRNYAKLSCSRGEQVLLNSHGVSRQRQFTRIIQRLAAMGRSGESQTGVAYTQRYGRRYQDIESAFKQDACDLREQLLESFDAVKGPSGKQKLLLSPGLVNRLFATVLESHANGDSIIAGTSRLEHSLGQRICSPLFTLKDEVHDPELIGACAWDDEGTATQPLTLVGNGVLLGFMESCRSAMRRGTRSTGHSRWLHAPSVTGGDATRQELGKLAGEHLLAREFSGRINSITGDFSGVLKQSRWINPKAGTDRPLVETMISGNVFELLKRIVAVSLPEDLNGYARMPWILVEGVEVSAG
jgi:PmbA protein